MKRPEIHIHIERIVLYGFDHIDAGDFDKALAAELEIALLKNGIPESLTDAGRNFGPVKRTIEIHDGIKETTLAKKISRTLLG